MSVFPDPAAEADAFGVSDTLIFHVTPAGLSLVGGRGRGVGWSGIVDVPMATEPLVRQVQRSSQPVRLDGAGEPVRVAGPYWARHAVLVPVGTDNLVVFGDSKPIAPTNAELMAAAARLVAELEQVSPAKLLADELEIVHAVRELMDYRPETVVDTARHIALKAAEPLSCEVGAVLVRHRDELVAEVVTREWPVRLDRAAIRGTLTRLFDRVESGPVLEPEIGTATDDALGREQGLVARLALPIGRGRPMGVLVVAHAEIRPRGFTNVCQRIGAAVADAAESLLVQAMSREELTMQRDQFAREARMDPLTGLANRLVWEELMEFEEARRARYQRPASIVSADVDQLKAINDRHGHPIGDAAIRAAADLLRRHSRGSDRVARVGGDEFLVFMPETEADGAARYLARVRSAARREPVEGAGTGLHLSLGAATTAGDEPLSATVARADAAMYATKRRHARQGSTRR